VLAHRLFVGEQRDVRVGNALLLFRRLDEGRRPFLELRRVLLVPGDASHDDDVGLLCSGWQCKQHEEQSQTQSSQSSQKEILLIGVLSVLCVQWTHYARPRALRNPHSPNTSPTSSTKSAGMSHSSRSSTTVTPRPL